MATAADRAITALGFDAFPAGSLRDNFGLQPFADAFGADLGAAALQAVLSRFPDSERGQQVAATRGTLAVTG